MRTYLLQDPDGQTLPTASVSAGLDYPGVGPEHAWLYDTGRASYRSVTDGQAMEALRLLAHTEGILCAIETAHAVHGAVELARELGPEQIVLVCLSGRGDKDMDTAARWFDLLDPARVSAATRGLPRRHGADCRRRPSGGGAVSRPLAEAFAAAEAEGRGTLVGYLPAGLTPGRDVHRDGRGRRRRGRGRPAVLGPGARRPGDPAGGGPGAGRRDHAGRRAAHGRGGGPDRRAGASS